MVSTLAHRNALSKHHLSKSLCAIAPRGLNLLFAYLFDVDERVDQVQSHQSHQRPAVLREEWHT